MPVLKDIALGKYVSVDSAVHRLDPRVRADQTEGLAALRARRDDGAVRRELDALREACRGDANLLECFVRAAHAYCTLGEMASVLREEFEEFKAPKIL